MLNELNLELQGGDKTVVNMISQLMLSNKNTTSLLKAAAP